VIYISFCNSNCPQNGIVVDLFSGTGSTAKAAYSVSRKFYGCEQDAACASAANDSLVQYAMNKVDVWTDDQDENYPAKRGRRKYSEVSQT